MSRVVPADVVVGLLAAMVVLLGSRAPLRAVRGPWTELAERGRGTAKRLLPKGSDDVVRRRCRELLDAFAAELRAGRSAPAALVRAGEPHPDLLVATLGAVRLGGDVPDALLVDGRAPGCAVLGRLSACWRVAEGTGAGLAAAVTRLADSARESERVRLELASRVAEPRATMRVLAMLPVLGVALGSGLGADTLGWLLTTAVGRVVLVVGVALDLFGLAWARRLVARVEAEL